MSKKEVAVIEKTIASIVAEATTLKVNTEDDAVRATELLSQLNKANDNIDEEKERVLGPLREAEKAERSRWKPAELAYKKGIEWLRSQLSLYQTAKVKAAKAEEAKIASRMGEGRGKISVDTAVRKIGEIVQPDKRVETSEGMVSFRTDKILKIVDENLIPRKYLKVDEKAVLAALIAGQEVAGAVVEEIQVPINKRK